MPRMATARARQSDIPAYKKRGDLITASFELTANIVDPQRPPEEQQVIEKAQDDLLGFIQYTFPAYRVDPFHAHVCQHLQEISGGTIRKLMLYAPPQHGKSEIVSTRFPGFFLAHNPDLPIAMVSYAATLAMRNSRYARSVCTSLQYADLYPHMHPDRENWRVEDWHFVGRKGYALAVGVGGPITGHGFGCILIDDPIENWAMAQSEAYRESIWQWYQGTLLTRLWERCRLVLMMTRWNKDDIAGRILESEGRVEEGGQWDVLEYPALAEIREGEKTDSGKPKRDILGRKFGEALAPSRYSREWLEDVRLNVGPMVWNAEYQQHPTDPEGDFFKIGRIEIVEAIPAEIGRLMQVEGRMPIPVELHRGTRFWDWAATEKSALSRDPDYTSGQLIAEHEGIWYVLDDRTGRYAPEDVQDLILQTAKLDGPKVRIRMEQEPGAAGIHLIERYIRLLAGYPVEGWPASGDTMTKAMGFAAQVNAGNVRLLKGDWNRAWLNELAGFPHAAHDDRVIAASGAFNSTALAQDRFRHIKFLKV